jgi:nucleotide-binding universal stress UspA family protein
MTIKTVIVHAEPGPGCDRRVRLAARVADLFDASVIGLGAEAFDVATISSGFAGTDGGAIEAVRELIATDLPAAEKHFRELVAQRRSLSWVASEGYPDKLLAYYARGADLIVTSRPKRGEGANYAARAADLVMEAGLPVLLAADSDEAFSGERIVVGWKDTRESRRAVTEALPFLKRARSVIIVAVCGEASTQIDQDGLKEVARRLARHCVEVSIEAVPKGKGSVADALEETAHRHSADMIVSGAYGHSRLQEWMLGGVTEDLVVSSSKFVLLSH